MILCVQSLRQNKCFVAASSSRFTPMSARLKTFCLLDLCFVLNNFLRVSRNLLKLHRFIPLMSLIFVSLLTQIATCVGQMFPTSFEMRQRAAAEAKGHTTSIEKVPHHVLVVYHNLYCSGSLISSRLVITAASCFARLSSNDKVVVKVGSESVVGPGDMLNVVQVKLHEFFTQLSDMDNDIAMLVLEASVALSTVVKKIPLLRDPMIPVDTDLMVTGWGSTNLPVKFVNKLLWSDMAVMNRAKCLETYGSLITHSNFCAHYSMTRRLSDNGGGAVLNGKLAGIVSFGANNKESPNVAVFTNVSYFYRWITVNARRFINMYCVKLHGSQSDQYTSASMEYQMNIDQNQDGYEPAQYDEKPNDKYDKQKLASRRPLDK